MAKAGEAMAHGPGLAVYADRCTGAFRHASTAQEAIIYRTLIVTQFDVSGTDVLAQNGLYVADTAYEWCGRS
jgi:hypothetical protein